MSWQGGVVSDSGGFQVMTLAKASAKRGNITDKGVIFRPQGSKKVIFTPEKSIRFQMLLNPDMVIVLDDFTPPKASYKEAGINPEDYNNQPLFKVTFRICKGEKSAGRKFSYYYLLEQLLKIYQEFKRLER